MMSNKDKLVIIGNGKIAKTLFHYLEQKFEVVCFAVEDSYCLGEVIEGGMADCSFEKALHLFPESRFLTCVGYGAMNQDRKRLYEKVCKETTFIPTNYICERAYALAFTMSGFNNLILDNVTIHPGASLGSNNIIWSQSVISHGASLGNNNWITAGSLISGDCKLGNNNFIGAGAVIAHNITIGSSCYVGANVLIDRDLDDNEVVVAGKSISLPYDANRFMSVIG
tara:strand:+ start:582 stop:1256 length:675 start_codon:yes stop_codon:yes gene_type:complete